MSARFYRRLIVAALLIAPTTLVAQGRGGGFGGGFGRGGRGGMGGMGGRGREGGQGAGARREPPPINSVDLILQRGHDLALSDSQVVLITAVKSRQDAAIAAVRSRADSAAPDAGPRARDLEASKDYREALKHGRDDAFAILEKKQRKQAEKLEKELTKELESEMPASAPGGRGGAGRRGTEIPVSTSVIVPGGTRPR